MKIKGREDFDIRLIKLDDYPELEKWWNQYKLQGIVIPSKNKLPNNGLGGFVVEKKGKLIASAFLYLTNSAVGYVDYLIADPSYRESDRESILIDLAAHVTAVAVRSGCEEVWAMTNNKKMLEMVEKNGEKMQMKVSEDDYKIVYTYLKENYE